jgi:hypothetical protein
MLLTGRTYAEDFRDLGDEEHTSRRGAGTGGWEELHKEELHYFTPHQTLG